ncbi:hypothetical protein FQN54_006614 [Arachnomyces sp. PD_36]|nr:hypothetical protein FQN54_006614 [Arachnomyces sp. PD_36]
MDRDRSFPEDYPSFTLKCEASTTRGYFELGNDRNGQIYGPLLEKWPSPEEMAREFNDYLPADFKNFHAPPAERDEFENDDPLYLFTESPDPFGTYTQHASGPLMTSAIAMFGNQSFFYIAANSTDESHPPPHVQICQSGNLPFSSYRGIHFSFFQQYCTGAGLPGSSDHPMKDWTDLLANWFDGFNDIQNAENALVRSMFLSNRATLTQTVYATLPFGARAIYFGPGTYLPLPYKTLAGTIIVSVLLFLQVLGLAFLTYYIYHVPTWTLSLNALSVARIGATMNENGELEGLDNGYNVNEQNLTKINGLVGLRDDDEAFTSDARIQLGGPHAIKREHATKTKKERKPRKWGSGSWVAA